MENKKIVKYLEEKLERLKTDIRGMDEYLEKKNNELIKVEELLMGIKE